MTHDDISFTADQYLAEANVARSAVFYTAWKAIGRIVAASARWLAEAHQRARMARKTYRTLHALSDRQLNDIGLSRDEIGSVAEAVVHAPPTTGLTIAELRQARPLMADSRSVQVAQLPGSDERWRKRAPSANSQLVGTPPEPNYAVG